MLHSLLRLVYEQGERDIIIMRHDVYVEWPDKKEEIRHLDFVCYGKFNR